MFRAGYQSIRLNGSIKDIKKLKTDIFALNENKESYYIYNDDYRKKKKWKNIREKLTNCSIKYH